MKKGAVTAVLTAVSLMLGMNIFSVSAKEEVPLIYPECGYAAENDIAQINIVTDKPIDISAFSVEIRFNPEELVFVDGEAGSSVKNGNFFCNGSYSEDCVRIVWSNSSNTTAQGQLAKLSFKTMSGTGGKTSTVSLGYSMFGNEKLKEIPFETKDSKIEIMSDYIRGDLNLDGYMTIADIVVINKYNVNSQEYPLGEKEIINADADYNQTVNNSDGGILLNEVMTASKGREKA